MSKKPYRLNTPGTCRECGCTEDNSCVDKNGKACYWSEPNLCSNCKKFTFTTFRNGGKKGISYKKTEDKMTDKEHDLYYGNLIQAWKNNTRKNRNRFLQDLQKTLNL